MLNTAALVIALHDVELLQLDRASASRHAEERAPRVGSGYQDPPRDAVPLGDEVLDVVVQVRDGRSDYLDDAFGRGAEVGLSFERVVVDGSGREALVDYFQPTLAPRLFVHASHASLVRLDVHFSLPCSRSLAAVD